MDDYFECECGCDAFWYKLENNEIVCKKCYNKYMRKEELIYVQRFNKNDGNRYEEYKLFRHVERRKCKRVKLMVAE